MASTTRRRTPSTATAPGPVRPTPWRGADRKGLGPYQEEYGGADFPPAAVERLDVVHRRLQALAAAGGDAAADEAFDLLDELDRATYARLAEVEEVAWQTLGRGLLALGYGGLWPALYALTDLCREGTYTPGDELRFLERADLPVREPPEGWPWLWAAPRGPLRATTGAAGSQA